MNLAQYVKCLKRHAKNRKMSDEIFLNAVLNPLVVAGKIDNRMGEEIYFDKSRTSLLMNQVDDVPNALREALCVVGLDEEVEENFKYFLEDYINKEDMEGLLDEICLLVKEDDTIADKEILLQKREWPNIFLADVLITAIKLKNNGTDFKGEIIRNGAYCVKVIYADIFKYAFRKRAKNKNIVVIPVDTAFHTHITRKYENDPLPEVSEKTIHGQWLSRWEKSGEDMACLSERISRDLAIKGYKCNDFGQYSMGTIATIETSSTIFYLLAIAEFDENNIAHTTKDQLQDTLDKLSIYYDNYGDAHDLTQSRDDSLNCTIKNSLSKRMNASKTFVLIVGDKTSSVTSGSCSYCNHYSSYSHRCWLGNSIDLRSYVKYECEKAARDARNGEMRIVVIYNYMTVHKEKCPEAVRNMGIHVPGICRDMLTGGQKFDYQTIKKAMMG